MGNGGMTGQVSNEVLAERLLQQKAVLERIERRVEAIETRMDADAAAEAKQLRTALVFLGGLLLSVLLYVWAFRGRLP